MKNTDLMEALCEADEEFVSETAPDRPYKRPPVLRVALIAAAAAAAVAILVTVLSLTVFNKKEPERQTPTLPAASETESGGKTETEKQTAEPTGKTEKTAGTEIKTTENPTETAEPTPTPTETAEPTPTPTEPVEPTPTPTEPVEPTPTPTEPVEPTPTDETTIPAPPYPIPTSPYAIPEDADYIVSCIQGGWCYFVLKITKITDEIEYDRKSSVSYTKVFCEPLFVQEDATVMLYCPVGQESVLEEKGVEFKREEIVNRDYVRVNLKSWLTNQGYFFCKTDYLSRFEEGETELFCSSWFDHSVDVNVYVHAPGDVLTKNGNIPIIGDASCFHFRDDHLIADYSGLPGTPPFFDDTVYWFKPLAEINDCIRYYQEALEKYEKNNYAGFDELSMEVQKQYLTLPKMVESGSTVGEVIQVFEWMKREDILFTAWCKSHPDVYF